MVMEGKFKGTCVRIQGKHSGSGKNICNMRTYPLKEQRYRGIKRGKPDDIIKLPGPAIIINDFHCKKNLTCTKQLCV